MNLSTITGIITAFFFLIFAYIIDGGYLQSLLSLPAALIVFGGTMGALIASFSLKEINKIPKLFMQTLQNEVTGAEEIIAFFINLSSKARTQGLLSLEEEIGSNDIKQFDPIIKDCLELVVDGTDSNLLRSIIENKIHINFILTNENAAIFKTAGSLAPTLGIVGTVMGLIHTLGTISEPEKLGPAIATTFIAILYGVSSASLFWLPVAHRLKYTAAKKRTSQRLILEGTVSIQEGKNPLILEKKLRTFITNSKTIKNKRIIEQ